MDTQPIFDPNDLLAHVVGDTANAVSERASEPQHRQHARRETAANTIMSFKPQDPVEAMLAGHCVMFHEMIVDSVHETLRGEAAATRPATRNSIVAMDKAFGNNLARLERYRTSHAPAEAQPVDARAETEIADRVRRHQSRPASAQTRSAPDAGTILRYPSPEAITASHASPEAAAALDTADSGGFAHVVRSEGQAEAWLTAAPVGLAGPTQLPGPRADGANGDGLRHAGNRQARRHPNP
jgi:hypothetical protein